MAETFEKRIPSVAERLRSWEIGDSSDAFRALGKLMRGAIVIGGRRIALNNGVAEIVVRRYSLLNVGNDQKRFEVVQDPMLLAPGSPLVLDRTLPPDTKPEAYDAATGFGDRQFFVRAWPIATALKQGGGLSLVDGEEVESLRRQTEAEVTNFIPLL